MSLIWKNKNSAYFPFNGVNFCNTPFEKGHLFLVVKPFFLSKPYLDGVRLIIKKFRFSIEFLNILFTYIIRVIDVIVGPTCYCNKIC